MDKTILSIDTANKISSVCLCSKEGIFSEESKGDSSNNEELSLLLEGVLKKANKEISEVDAILLNQGPGSFTGLRIGYAYIIGICSCLNIPVYEISFLEAFCKLKKEGKIISSLKMKKDNFFIYDKESGGLNFVTSNEIKVLIDNNFKIYLLENNIDEEIPFSYEKITDLPSKVMIDFYKENKLEPTNILSLSPNYIQKISAKKINER